VPDHSRDGEVAASHGFAYEIVRRPRRTRPAISVSRDLKVRVLLPARAPESVARQLACDKADWVRRKLAEFRARTPPERRWVDGETLPWLGREHPLRVTASEASAGQDDARLREGAWLVRLAGNPDGAERAARVRAALRQACMHMAREELGRRASGQARRMNVTPSLVDVKSYRSRWGSCHGDGRVYFNWRIALAPEFVVDYVVTHELCHLVHRNHSPAFRAMVEQWMPEWKAAHAWLREHGRRLEALDA